MLEPISADSSDELTRRVGRLLQARAGLPAEALQPDLRLADLGLDSVGLLELLLECERACGARLPGEMLEGAPLTFAQLVAALAKAAEERGR